MARFDGLTLVSGDDDYRRRDVVRETLARLVPEQDRDFNYDRFPGKSVEPEALLSALSSPPMMAERRVVHIDEAEALGKELRTRLAELLDQLSEREVDDVALLLVYGPGKKPPRQFTQRAAAHEKLGGLRWRDAESWVQSYAERTHGRMLGRGVARVLLESLGPSDSGRLANEVDRLMAVAGEEDITPETVALATGVQRGRSGYDISDAMGERDFGKAARALDDVLASPEWSGVRIAVTLSYHLSDLALLRARRDQGLSVPEASAGLGWRAKKLVAQSRNWTLVDLDRALAELGATDLALKTGADERQALRTFLHRTLARTQAPPVTRRPLTR